MRMTALMLVLLAGCEAQTPTPRDVATGEAEGVPPTPAIAPLAPDEAEGEPILSPLTRADFESRLEPGYGCNIARGDALLLVAVSGDAVAKVDGRVVDLAGGAAELDQMVEGGRYWSEGLEVVITPTGETTEGSGSAERSAEVMVTAGPRVERFRAPWACGS